MRKLSLFGRKRKFSEEKSFTWTKVIKYHDGCKISRWWRITVKVFIFRACSFDFVRILSSENLKLGKRLHRRSGGVTRKLELLSSFVCLVPIKRSFYILNKSCWKVYADLSPIRTGTFLAKLNINYTEISKQLFTSSFKLFLFDQIFLWRHVEELTTRLWLHQLLYDAVRIYIKHDIPNKAFSNWRSWLQTMYSTLQPCSLEFQDKFEP